MQKIKVRFAKSHEFRASMRKAISRLCFGYMQLSHILVVATYHVERLSDETILLA